VCGFHFARVDARDAAKPAAADRVRSCGACCFRAPHFACGHFNGGTDDGRERAQIARPGRSLRPARSLWARRPGCARWPGFAGLPVKLLEDARLDLTRARDQIVLKARGMEPLDAFAANVRRLRKERGLTQERLAELADLHMTDIARIETQGRDPGVKVLAKIAHGLGVPASELLEGVEHQPPSQQ